MAVTYAVAFADAAGVVDVARPRQTERSAVKVTIGEHVGETERVVVVLGEEFEERLHAVVAREPTHQTST